MYKLINVNKPSRVFATNSELAPLFQMLDNAELKYQAPVVVNETGEIVAGHNSAWGWAKHKQFKVTN